MTAVVGRVWAWMSPSNMYRPWGNKRKLETTFTSEGRVESRWGFGRVTSWIWGGQGNQCDPKTQAEEYWEAEEETHKPLEIEELTAAESETAGSQSTPRWWSRVLPSSFFRLSSTNSSGLGQRKFAVWNEAPWDSDSKDGELSDYGTPPPSPTPLSQRSSLIQVLAHTWTGDILPEHYEICFNFLRHLFDLFVVGFLWMVSPPTKFILDILGVHGALKLWLHGMAMFFVSSVGMAGLLWLVQEYLPQFALVYGIIQALVISVSVQQSVILGTGANEVQDGKVEEEEDAGQQSDTTDSTNKGVDVH
ncbi:hypothetical protein P4O66_003560 [Electrophorus voltai]|uniref:Uncharacterized protein n=2 Tax=Electrophorus TaxID=8004 RepID=A0A4W4GLB1_ELEEL|nr:uncharacterized protein C6orf47 homolog [Electrophorus electricus]KAK1804703.1 hypothetical protein P4O66_003560 [Electrophorus voltai]